MCNTREISVQVLTRVDIHRWTTAAISEQNSVQARIELPCVSTGVGIQNSGSVQCNRAFWSFCLITLDGDTPVFHAVFTAQRTSQFAFPSVRHRINLHAREAVCV